MYINTLDPAIFHLGPLEVRWYGLVYVLGFLSAGWLLQKNRHLLQLSKDEVWDLLLYIVLGVVIGARLFEIFWEPSYYLSDITRILWIWEGGMSFHGGFVGVVMGVWYYCKKKKKPFLDIADLLSLPAIIALALGRIANFINGELIGRAWDGRWCVIFPNYDNVCRHPSTLYAAAERFIVACWLYFLTKRKWNPGFIFWNFVFWEGLGRFLVDFYREDILYYSLSLGQWMSSVMILVSLWMFWKNHREDCRNLFKP